MHIVWHGQSCFQVQVLRQKGEQTSLIIDPFSEEIGLRLPKISAADVVLVTHDHSDHNNKKGMGGSPFLIEGPGEYETREIFVEGIPSWHDNANGGERGGNTIYAIEAEDMRLCHLGDLGQKELTENQLERIGEADILMIPVGGVYTITASDAVKIIAQIEPRIVIPMHYAIPGLKVKLDGVDKFLKEMGVKSVEPQQKLLIKKKDLPQEETKVMLLKP